MKKIYILMIAILIGGIAKGQSKHFTLGDFKHSNQKKVNQDDLNNGSKLYNNRSVECNFDTLFLYDASNNIYKRITNIFDSN